MLDKIIERREIAANSGEPILRPKSFELLLEIIKDKKPSKILEIGVNVGLSGIAMLLTSTSSSLTGIEIDEDKIAIAKKNYIEFGVSERAKIFQGDAGAIIPLLTGKYDFIFLDGPKGHYYEYLPSLLSALNKGGILFADNVLFRGYVGDKIKTPHRFATTKHSMENFLRAVTESDNLETQIFDMEDGVSVTKRIK